MRKLKKPLSILLSVVMILSVFTIVPFSVSAEDYVDYIDRQWDAEHKTVVETAETIRDYTPLTKNTTSPDSGAYVLDSDVTFAKRMVIGNGKDVSIILCNGYTLTNKKGINVKEGGKLTIYGQEGDSGNIDVFNEDGAAIGAMDNEKAGTIIIKGGHIVAEGGNKDAGIGSGKSGDSGYEEISIFGGKIESRGGSKGAGIGAGYENDNEECEHLNIYGGTVKANGGNRGAGIGGGDDSSVNAIDIYGGNITAKGEFGGAGIGSGYDENNNGSIRIHGGTIKASCDVLGGAGIGAGNSGDSKDIQIYGGTVTAEGARGGAGIGGGDGGENDSVIINGGDITAKGSSGGAGIGGGNGEGSNMIKIYGGNVKARSSDGAGIGGGNDGTEGIINIYGGTVKAISKYGAGIGSGNEENTDGEITIDYGTVFAVSTVGAGIGGGNHSDLESDVVINGGEVYARSGVMVSPLTFDMINAYDMLALAVDLFHSCGAGIGGGCYGSQDNTVYINGGVVHAYGGGTAVAGHPGLSGAGIGGGVECEGSSALTDWLFRPEAGDGGEGGPVKITGGTLIAFAAEDSCPVGYGKGGSRLKSLTIPDEYCVCSGNTDDIGIDEIINTVHRIKDTDFLDHSSVASMIKAITSKITAVPAADRVKACRTENSFVVITPCHHLKRTYTVKETTHSMFCTHCKYTKIDEPHKFSKNLCECNLVNNVANRFTWVNFIDPMGDRSYETFIGTEYTLPEGRNKDLGSGTVDKFTEWKDSNGTTYKPGDKINITAENMTFTCNSQTNYITNVSDNITNGAVYINKEMAPAGEEVKISLNPKHGYKVKSAGYYQDNHGIGYDFDTPQLEYTITMPDSPITVYAEFEQRTDIHNHGDMTFEPYPVTGNISVDAGTHNYYLTKDSIAPGYINTEATVNLCLNGHKLIIPNNGLSVYPGAELNIYDCSYDTEITTKDDGTQEVVIKDKNSTKGVISGGRITVQGSLNMYGGNIKGSKGVRVDGTPGVFNMYGGKIEGNTSSSHGAGVYVANGEVPNIFNIRGDVSISGNKYTGGSKAVEENVYLEQGAEIKIVADEPLADTTKIGVTSAKDQMPVQFTSALGENASVSNFFSDNDNYIIEENRVGCAQLQRLYNLRFDANGGSGTMDPETVRNNFYYLPGCGFDAPAGKVFAGWKIDGKIYNESDPLTLDNDETAVAQWSDYNWDIWVNGKKINNDNKADILGDGTASYDNVTNTLTLNNATIEVQEYNPSLAAGIRYNEQSDKPFNIVLNGTNKIVNETPESDVYDTYCIMLTDTADGYIISGNGSLDIETNADEEAGYYGILSGKDLTINSSSVNINIPGTAKTAGIDLYNNNSTLTLQNSADVNITTGSNDRTYALSGNNNSNLVAEDGESKFTASSGNKAFSENITLSDNTKARGAYVKAQPDGGLGVWDDTTPLTEFSSVSIPGENTFGAHLVGHSISLDGSIGVNFYMELSDSVVNGNNDPYMLFNIPDTSKEYKEQKVYLKTKEGEQRTVAEEVVDPTTDKTYYMFKCRVAAKDMESEITAQMFDGENEKGGVYTYSVKKYADYLMDNAYTDDTHETVKNQTYADAYDLVDAMLTYGDQAKTYFDDTAVDVELNPVTNSISNNGYDTPIDVSVFDGATLSLKSQTTLSLYFKSDKALTLSIDGKTEGVDYELKNADDEYVIRIRNIAVKELDQPIEVNVSYDGYSGTVSYSPLRYCYLAANSESTGNKLKNAVNALYNYYLAAKAYFSDINSQSGGGE